MRSVAFYLPQYHPIPENDAWWGKGFTEWHNVSKASPRFRGHTQPHIPRELGFYDLRLPETREAQAALAREYGISAFCYYHYWFEGKRLLERPFSEVLASGRPDFPFMLCWANENWTRVWDGGQNKVLQPQRYSERDDQEHIRSLLPALHDPRYVTIDGRPVLLVYRASNLPDPRRTTETWREEARKSGLPDLYLCRVEQLPTDRGNPVATGFDAGVEFAPDFARCGPRIVPSLPAKALRRLLAPNSGMRRNNVYHYDEVVRLAIEDGTRDYVRFRCVTPSWDNSARRERAAHILIDSTPEKYQRWVEAACQAFTPPTPEEDLFFVNAWNEWAEGNHLEPDLHWGRSYLEAHLAAMTGVHHQPTTRPNRTPFGAELRAPAGG